MDGTKICSCESGVAGAGPGRRRHIVTPICREITLELCEDIEFQEHRRCQGAAQWRKMEQAMAKSAERGRAGDVLNLAHVSFESLHTPGFGHLAPALKSRRSDGGELCGDLLSLQQGGHWDDCKGDGWLASWWLRAGRKRCNASGSTGCTIGCRGGCAGRKRVRDR